MLTFSEWVNQQDCNEIGIEIKIESTKEWLSDLLASDIHYGNCTKQNITCKLCMLEILLDEYYEYMKKQ